MQSGVSPGTMINNSTTGPIPAIRPGMGPPNLGIRPPGPPF